MNPDLQRRVQRYGWDKAAAHYETLWGEQLAPSQDLLLEKAKLKPEESVIDIACGTGLISFPAAEQVGSDGSLLGTDLSGKMVEVCREIAADRGLSQCRFERMDAENLAVDNDTFDVALSSLGIMYYPSPDVAVSEMHRVTKPGGRVVISTWGKRSNCGWADIFPIVDSRVNTDVCPLFFDQGTGDRLKDTMDGAGFSNVEIDRINVPLHYSSFEDACNAAFVGGPVAMAYSRFDDATKAEAHEEYRQSIEDFRNGDGYEIPGEFVVGRGVKP